MTRSLQIGAYAEGYHQGIIDERERCAKIADEHAARRMRRATEAAENDGLPLPANPEFGRANEALNIAKKIRTQTSGQ